MPAVVSKSKPYSPEEVDRALEALIAHSGNAAAAHEYLQVSGLPSPSAGTLSKWSKTTHFERYEELREEYAAKREGQLANNFLDGALEATEAAIIAASLAKKRLATGKDDDPARTAANLASMAQRLTDKRLALQGRPSRITENRDATEILRGLVARGVLVAPDEPPQLESGEE